MKVSLLFITIVLSSGADCIRIQRFSNKALVEFSTVLDNSKKNNGAINVKLETNTDTQFVFPYGALLPNTMYHRAQADSVDAAGALALWGVPMAGGVNQVVQGGVPPVGGMGAPLYDPASIGNVAGNGFSAWYLMMQNLPATGGAINTCTPNNHQKMTACEDIPRDATAPLLGNLDGLYGMYKWAVGNPVVSGTGVWSCPPAPAVAANAPVYDRATVAGLATLSSHEVYVGISKNLLHRCNQYTAGQTCTAAADPPAFPKKETCTVWGNQKPGSHQENNFQNTMNSCRCMYYSVKWFRPTWAFPHIVSRDIRNVAGALPRQIAQNAQNPRQDAVLAKQQAQLQQEHRMWKPIQQDTPYDTLEAWETEVIRAKDTILVGGVATPCRYHMGWNVRQRENPNVAFGVNACPDPLAERF